VVSYVNSIVSEKHTSSIFRAEVTMLGSGTLSQPSFLCPCIMPPIASIITSALNIEEVCPSKMLVSTYKTKLHQNTKLHHHHCHGNFKGESYVRLYGFFIDPFMVTKQISAYSFSLTLQF
jgi:hypothetical protein